MKLALFALSMIVSSLSYAQILEWVAPTEREDGTSIGEDESMFYTLYYNTGSGRFRVSTTVDETFISLDQVPVGCYNLRVTATFHHDKTLQSEPSNEVYYCVDGDGKSTDNKSPPKPPAINIGD